MTGKYHAYSKYKNSSVEWLGDIPAHWDVTRIKHLVSTPVTDGPHETPDFIDSGIPFISAEAVSSGNINFDKIRAHISEEDNELYSIKYSPKLHDIYMVKSGATTGVTAIVETSCPFNIWSPLAAIRCNETSSPYFVLNFLRSNNFQEAVELNWSFGTQQNIGMGVIENLCVTRPPLEEAKIIADFLIHETVKINGLIEKQRLLIKLLKEKRQAVISHAVTKGLTPSNPMKDSGVEWLGEVPEHWILKNYRYATQIHRGKFGHRPRNDRSLYDGGIYPFIQTGDVAGASKYITKYKQTLNEKGIGVSQKFPSGTLVMAIAANIGDTAILDFEAYAPDSVVGFKPNDDIYLEFLRYSLMAALPALEKTSTQSTQANLNIDRVGTVKAVFPPLLEQKAIVIEVDRLIEKYLAIELKAKSAILLMQERRTALISAAVTGKIDVRNWQAPEQPKNDKEQVA